MLVREILEATKTTIMRKTLRSGKNGKGVRTAVRALSSKSKLDVAKDIVNHGGIDTTMKDEVPGEELGDISTM